MAQWWVYFRSKERAPKGYRRVRQNRRSQGMIVRDRIVQWRENPAHQPQDEQKHISVYEKVFAFYMCTYEHICNYHINTSVITSRLASKWCYFYFHHIWVFTFVRWAEEFFNVSWPWCVLKTALAGLSILLPSSRGTGISVHTWGQTSFPVGKTSNRKVCMCSYVRVYVCGKYHQTWELLFGFILFWQVSELILKASVHVEKILKYKVSNLWISNVFFLVSFFLS